MMARVHHRAHAIRCRWGVVGAVSRTLLLATVLPSIAWSADTSEETRLRARDLGIVIGSTRPGPLNAITDVAGVAVGHVTLMRGEGALQPG
ncbi:MAG: hypothetical protein HZB35_12185, partial [Nitrospirae bacterium]|nr:hypothetical protein [Nitrospirota bacterium]